MADAAALRLRLNSWIFYATVITVVVVRLISQRLVNKSWRKLKVDDYLMAVTFLFYTATIAVMEGHAVTGNMRNGFQDGGANNIPQDRPLLDDQKSPPFADAGIIGLSIEVLILTTVWGVKMSLLVFYHRLTFGQGTINNIIKGLLAYVLLTYAILLVLLLGLICRPISQYWAFQPDNEQCRTYKIYFITHLALNISSDIGVILVPITFLRKLTLPRFQKWGLIYVFSLGVLSMGAACVTKAYTIGGSYNINWQVWYVREASTAMLAGNIPLCLPVLKVIFRLWSKRKSVSSTGNDDIQRVSTHNASTASHSSHVLNRSQAPFGTRAPQNCPEIIITFVSTK